MIQFQNKSYETRLINLPEFGEILISTTSLNDLLLTDSGGYVSDEALFVDEQIFYFVRDDEMNLSDNHLKELLISQVV